MFDVKRQEKRIFFIFIIAVLLYAAVILSSDIKKFQSISSSFNWLIVLLLIILSYVNYLFRFVRWNYLLKEINVKLSLKKSFNIFFSGIAMTVTPGKMGEVLKAYLVKKETGNKFAEMVPLLVFERFTDGVAMILLALGGVYFFDQSRLFFVFASALVVGFAMFVYAKDYVVAFIKWFEGKFFHLKILDFAITFFENSQKLLTYKNFSIALIFALSAWLVEGTALFILVSQFIDVPVAEGLFKTLFIFSFSSIAGFLAVIPGGIGVAEGAISSLLILLFGVDISQAIFITLIFRFVTLWFGVGLGSTYVLQYLHGTSKSS